MEKITEWVRTCLHKVKMSERHADDVIKMAKRSGTSLRKYYCPHCFNWHVTSKINNLN